MEVQVGSMGKANKGKNAKRLRIKTKAKGAKRRQRRVLRVDALDQILLRMAAKPYEKILKKIEVGKKRISDERRMALLLGSRILNKAKKVRDSLIRASKPRR